MIEVSARFRPHATDITIFAVRQRRPPHALFPVETGEKKPGLRF
jgi:hypothetical protein